MCVCASVCVRSHCVYDVPQFSYSNLDSTTEEVTITNSGHKVCAVCSESFIEQNSLSIIFR